MTAARDITGTTAWHLSRDGSADARVITVTIPVRTVSETNQREHWGRRHRRRRQLRQTVGLVMAGWLRSEGFEMPHCSRQDGSGARLDPEGGSAVVRIVLTRLAPSAGLDFDNLVSSMKAVVDGLADALGIDDRDPRVAWGYAQRRSKPRSWGVEIRIEKG